MREFDTAKLTFDLYKQAVDVQQHFNDIEWRIRALGLSGLTFTYGATFIAIPKTSPIKIYGLGAYSPAGFIPLIGLVLWTSFWFVDAGWYHRFLVGSVQEGIILEARLNELGFPASLGAKIGAASPITLKYLKRRPKSERARLRLHRSGRSEITKSSRVAVELHSREKLHLFYVINALALVVFSLIIFAWSHHDAAAINFSINPL